MNILNRHQLADPQFYDPLTITDNKDERAGLFLMWNLGTITERIMDVSRKENVPILLEPFRKFSKLFDVFGQWIFLSHDYSEIPSALREVEVALQQNQDKVYHDIMGKLKQLHRDSLRLLAVITDS